MATYVLVHGGAHGGWCWNRVAPILRSAGHDVYTPTPTGLGERAHLLRDDVDLEMHIADICAVLSYENLSNVILAGHSYGGMVITGVADKMRNRIRRLVFLDALHPRDGDSLADLSPQILDVPSRISADGIELVLLDSGAALFGVTDPDDLAWVNEKLTPHPRKCFTQRLRLSDEGAVFAIPRASINCTESLRRWLPDTAARAGNVERVWEIDTGHDLMITEPRAVADLLLLLASR